MRAAALGQQAPLQGAVPDQEHVVVLDGWRGISVLLVLATHLLPLGPKLLKLNHAAGPMGMALFFTLSGFLICRFLLKSGDVAGFLIRRLCRILPLAWLGLLLIFLLEPSPLETWAANFLFYANLPPQHLTHAGSHYWSLCVEVQFYLGIAALAALFGRKGLYAVPGLCLLVTGLRISAGAEVNIVTWLRGDEILAGATLALAVEGKLGPRARSWVLGGRPLLLLLLLFLSSHPWSGPLNYARPYFAALLVGSTLALTAGPLYSLLSSPVLGYVAKISYALYVFHHILMYTWLGSGDKLVKYLKRPLLFLATFALAHLSTKYYEERWIRWGKQWSRRRRTRVPA